MAEKNVTILDRNNAVVDALSVVILSQFGCRHWDSMTTGQYARSIKAADSWAGPQCHYEQAKTYSVLPT